MKIQLLRHATLTITSGDVTLLVDPLLAPAGTYDPIANTTNQRRNPLVDLPFDDQALEELLQTVDGVIVTHTHNDHWDQAARDRLPKALPVFCQPEDLAKIRGAGFEGAQAVEDSLSWRSITLHRTDGQHGFGEIGRLMAPVSGFVIKAPEEPVVYVAGDTLWCPEVQAAIAAHEPEVIIVNAGGARFKEGGPITMTAEDVRQVLQAGPQALVIAVHMEAINHCLLRRADLQEALAAMETAVNLHIPADGEEIFV